MKFIGKYLLALMVLFCSADMFAQKIGHFNSIELMTQLPAYKSAQTSLETFAKMKKTELSTVEEKLIADYEQFLKKVNAGEIAPIEQERKAREFEQRQRELEEAHVKAQQAAVQKETDLIKPLEDKLKAAMDAVAAENGYDYIIDTSVGRVVYADPAGDITQLLKAKM